MINREKRNMVVLGKKQDNIRIEIDAAKLEQLHTFKYQEVQKGN